MNANEIVRAKCKHSNTCRKTSGWCISESAQLSCVDYLTLEIESLQAQLADKTALLDGAIAGQETLQRALTASQRRERAYEAAIKRHYADMTSQCFICYSCVNHDARGHWNGKEPYACSGCGKSHPKWRFDEGRFAQEGTK